MVPRALEALHGQQYEASDIAGQTIQIVTNLVEFNPGESVLDFLHRMQEDQDNLTKYASAPLKSIMSRLGDETAQTLLEVSQSLLFNWAPD